MQAWTLADAWILPNARERDPAPPERFLNQVLARYLVAASPGFPPGTAERAEPACAVCSPAMGPQEQRPLAPGLPVVSCWRNPGQTYLVPPWQDFRVPPRNAFRGNRRHGLGHTLESLREFGSPWSRAGDEAAQDP